MKTTLGLLLVSCLGLTGLASQRPPLASLPLVQASTLRYAGAFRLPSQTVNGSLFEYGGTALTFHPRRGSLYLTGHDWHQKVAEVTVPRIRTGRAVSDLAVASFLQPFADVTDGRLSAIDTGSVKLGGLLVSGDRLYATAYAYYDGDGSQRLSHFISGQDLSVSGDVRGPYAVGAKAGLVAGYMAHVPEAWRAALGGRALTGQCCLSIISRTSYGPAVSAFEPSAIPAGGHAIPLLFYPAEHPLAAWDTTNPLFNGSTQVRGLVFPEGTRSLLFFGRHGTGRFCYGSGADCGDPAESSQGTHGYPYRYQVWAYDAARLAEVRRGSREPWSVRPYATWFLDLPFQPANGEATLNGAAYDPATRRIFLAQAYADHSAPLIHVFVVEGGR